MFEAFPEKLKGMHWRTYERLRAKADEAQGQSWPPWLLKLMHRDAQGRPWCSSFNCYLQQSASALDL
jgi:hypothetical protein